MKNEIKISRLMDVYTDNEFFIQGESEVNLNMVKNNVISKAAGASKRVKPLAKVLIAAAVAAVLAVGATAATIAIKGGYTTPTGIGVSYEAGEDYGSWSIHYNDDRDAPIKVEEGNRLMFVADGQNIDITDLVDENTPYIYSYGNSEGDACYIIVGGAAGDYGYIDLLPIKVAGDAVKWSENGYNTGNILDYDGREIRDRFKSWCLAAFDELEVWDDICNFGENNRDPAGLNESFGYVFSASYSGQ